jgi:hypothetical protein
MKQSTKIKSKICSICKKPYEGFGNNAQPVNSGRCCDDCNWNVVIPVRLNAQLLLLRREGR